MNKISQTIIVKVDHIIYRNDTFYILTTSAGKLKGNILDCGDEDIVGMEYKFIGTWQTSKYGDVFSFEYAEMQCDQLFFFLSKIVKNVGPNLAKVLIDTFGDKLELVIATTPRELLSIKGIGEAKLKNILKSWEKYGYLMQLSKFIGSYGLSPALITKIYNKFGDQAIGLIADNPYILSEISGVGFAQADVIALKMGIPEKSTLRINAACLNVLVSEANQNGHSLIQLTGCISKVKELLQLDMSTEDVTAAIADNDRLQFAEVNSSKVVGFKTYFEYEKIIYNYLIKNADQIVDIISKADVNGFIKEYEQESGLSLSDQQKWAVFHACTRKQFALSGYAGTGKSSTARLIMNILANLYGNDAIVGCAFSGIAARRLNTVTGFPAFTIHSLLGFQAGHFTMNEENKLREKVIVLDEAGMVNSYMFASLLKAIRDDAILIMIGDDAQLPPIGAGNVFSDYYPQKIQLHKQAESSLQAK